MGGKYAVLSQQWCTKKAGEFRHQAFEKRMEAGIKEKAELF
jgi:hypothetical protein